MKPNPLVIRKALAAGLSALLLVMSVASPWMDRGGWAHEAAIESSHAPGTCPTQHDHRICTQIGVNLALAAAQVLAQHPPHLTDSPSPVVRVIPALATYFEGNPSRAPPGA